MLPLELYLGNVQYLLFLFFWFKVVVELYIIKYTGVCNTAELTFLLDLYILIYSINSKRVGKLNQEFKIPEWFSWKKKRK